MNGGWMDGRTTPAVMRCACPQPTHPPARLCAAAHGDRVAAAALRAARGGLPPHRRGGHCHPGQHCRAGPPRWVLTGGGGGGVDWPACCWVLRGRRCSELGRQGVGVAVAGAAAGSSGLPHPHLPPPPPPPRLQTTTRRCAACPACWPRPLAATSSPSTPATTRCAAVTAACDQLQAVNTRRRCCCRRPSCCRSPGRRPAAAPSCRNLCRPAGCAG